MEIFIDGSQYKPIRPSRRRVTKVHVETLKNNIIAALSQPNIDSKSKLVFTCTHNGKFGKKNTPVFLYKLADNARISPHTILTIFRYLIGSINLDGSTLSSFATSREYSEKDGTMYMNLIIRNFYFDPIR